MARSQTITSAANPLIKDVRRAVARGSLTDEGWCVAETFHLLDEALRSQCKVTAVLAAENVQDEVERRLGPFHRITISVLPNSLFQSIAGTQTTQGVMALVQPPDWTAEQIFRNTPLVLVLDGVQDPGNAGTLVRTAEAFGVTGILLLKGTVSPWNPKSLRASAGSSFRVPLLQGIDAAQALDLLLEHRIGLYAGVPAGASPSKSLFETDLTGPCSLVIGSEGQGVSETLRAAARGVYIPTVGVESLNAAMAAGILLYEARRQRSQHP